MLNNDPIFDSPTGQYLCYFDKKQGKYLPFRWQPTQTKDDVTNGYVLLGNHVTAIQGALGLTANEVESILNDNTDNNDNLLDISSAPLTLANVSLLYRYALLSQGLQLSVDDFIALKQMSVDQINTPPLNPVNPFDSLNTTPLAVLRDDHPWGETIQLTDQAAKVQASGFSVQDLQYILCHQIVDPAGPYNQDPAVVMQQVRSLAAIIHAIQAQTTAPSDPTKFTDDLIRQKMSQVFPPDVVQTFMGMWAGTIQYTATPVNAASAIPSTVFSDQSSIQLVYDQITTTQTIIMQGVPTSSVMNNLTAELGTLVTQGTITAAQQTLLQGLLNDIQTQALTFFQTYLQQSTVGVLQTGFLQPADFNSLFVSPPGAATARATLAAEFLPYLQYQLISQAIIQSMVAELGADASLTKTLLTNTAVLSDPTQAAASPIPLLAAFEASGDTGVSVTYFSGSSEGTTTSIGLATLATANTDQVTNPSKPANVNSAHFEGYLEVPTDGPYNFTAILPNNTTASVAFQFDFMTTPVALTAGPATGTPAVYPYSGYPQVMAGIPGIPYQFKAGIPYHFTLDFQGLNGGDAHLLVQGETLPLGPLSQLTLYPEASVQRYNRAQILLAKTLQLIRGFKLDEIEVIYIVTHPADFDNISFNSLPTQSEDYSPATAQKLFGQFLRLANYADLRKGPAGNTDGLINIFQNAQQTIPVTTPLQPGVMLLQVASQNFYQAVANLTRRDALSIQAVITQLWGTSAIQTATTGAGTQAQFQFTVAPLVNDLGFRRLWDALQMVQTLGVQPQVLKQTTCIVNPSSPTCPSDPNPGSAIASLFRNAVKSQYTPDQWRPVAQSVFDPLRQRKRDALCAYILTLPDIVQFGATDTNGLFEYFLVDPGMEPVVQTSRIRLAISSVQTFIQRCLLNLEQQVKPSIIDSNHWDWMKRYRVWDANREIFLWPENWLIPEFRENTTDLFQALQGTLLQGDITQDLVVQAFTQYLQDLDTRARLDIVSLFNQAPAAGDASTANILHVIGRNHSKPMKYFYRTFSNGVWSGWIPVTPDIEGDHIVAVIWRGRLNIFWLTFVVQGSPPATPPSPPPGNICDLTVDNFNSLVTAGKQTKTVQVQLNWSEYYQGKWTPRKSSDITRFNPISVSDPFDPVTDVYVYASIDTDSDGNETAVRIQMQASGDDNEDNINQAFRMTSKNSEPSCSKTYWLPRYTVPYSTVYSDNGGDATKDVGYIRDPIGTPSGVLQVNFYDIILSGCTVLSVNSVNQLVLQTVNSFNLLLNNLNFPGMDLDNDTIAEIIDALIWLQMETLSSPFFYEDTSDYYTDHELTFFVQPNVTEKTTVSYNEWAIGPFYPDQAFDSNKYFNVINLTPQVPDHNPPISPDLEAVFPYRSNVDWIASEPILISYGTSVIGSEGGIAVSKPLPGGKVSQMSVGLSNSPFSASSITTAGAGVKVISSSGLDYASALSLAIKAQTQSVAVSAASDLTQ